MKSGLRDGHIPKLPGWLTVPEVAQRLGCTPNRINQLVHKNRFVPGEEMFCVGSAAIVIKEEAVQRYLRQRALTRGDLIELVPDALDEIEQIANGKEQHEIV